ncbi:TIGR04222 domain-containing membrane protein [Nocardiopsis sp. NPDC050513]|uniref:TIGR04222 domain-containing membrane protein n=1 Tax=Nocardiopsis sp. NPDC050513 TaxID=3364338 RepID=UPI00378A3524
MVDGVELFLMAAAAVVAGAVVGGSPLVAVLRSRAAIRSAIRRGPGPGTPPDPDELTPAELGYLLGGAVRAAEVAVTDAFLSGRVRQQSAGGFFTLVGPRQSYLSEKDPLRRAILRAFRDRVGVGAREMVRRVVTGRAVDGLRDGLVRRGLIVDSPEIRELLAHRRRRARSANVVIGGAFTLAVVLLVLGSAATLGVAWLTAVGCMGAVGGALAVRVVVAATGGANPSTTTPAGTAVAAEARRRYTASGAMSRDRALRHTAVTGFRSLRAATSSPGRARTSLKRPAADRSSSGDAVPTVSADASSQTYDLHVLCSFAELCQGSSSSAGGSSSGDGWGGGFETGSGGGGGFGSGGDGGGGGWGGFGGGDSGGGGGDGGGGGGGD